MRSSQSILRYILRLNISFQFLNSYPTTRGNEIRLTPESRISIVGVYLLTKLFANETTGNSFQIVDEFRYLHLGIKTKQQMNVVSLSIDLNHFTIPLQAGSVDDFNHPG